MRNRLNGAAILFLLMGSFLSACATPAVENATPTLPPLRTVEAATTPIPPTRVIPTHTSSITQTPTIALTPTGQITPLPAAAGRSLAPVAVLQDFSGPWSPAADSLAGIAYNQDGIGRLALAGGPDFRLDPFDLGGLTYGDWFGVPAVGWSPDGEWVLFGNSETEDPVMDFGIPSAIRPTGQDAHPILKDAGGVMGLRYQDWIDTQTFVITEYNGGGAETAYVVDFLTGDILTSVMVQAGRISPGRLAGIPLSVEYVGPTLGVITLEEQPEAEFWFNSTHIRWIPVDRSEYEDGQWGMRFVTWVPNRDSLVAFQETVEEIDDAQAAQVQLVEWDLEKDQVSPFAPNGIDARFSPDGRTLALVTLGRPVMDGLGYLQPAEPDRLLLEDQAPSAQLSLVETESGRVLPELQIEIAYRRPGWFLTAYEALLAFSPDSRYLAFISAGEEAALNVFDLSTMRMVVTAPSLEESELIWSPGGDRLCYQTPDGGYAVFDRIRGERIGLAVDHEEPPSGCAWSFDGEYLSLTAREIGEGEHGDTFIFSMGE